jgi:hypothetical protein
LPIFVCQSKIDNRQSKIKGLLMLTFLSPLLLIGAFSAAIPLIIHLSRSRRTKKMRFSTTRFFTDQFLRSYRMSRLKELLLLTCRMALFALLAMAFAQPLFQTSAQPLFGGGSRSVVLVIDNSASMGYTENGKTLLDRVRVAAREIIEDLGPNDTVSVVLGGRHESGPRVLTEHASRADIGDALQSIDTLPVATLAGDLSAALVRAEEIAQKSAAASKEVYVLSDLQHSSWDEDNEALKAKPGSEVLFFFVRIRPKAPSNVAITAVQYMAGRPMAGVPFSIRPLVVSQGDTGQNSVVRLYIYNNKGEAEKVGERPLEKRAHGGWAAPRFYHTFTTGGWHSGYVEVDDANLPQDNRRYFALQVLDGVDVLAINGVSTQVRDIDRDPVFFLRAALLAANFQVKKGTPDEAKPMRVKEDEPAALARLDLRKYPLVVLANVARLTGDAHEKLEKYVDGGGSLLIFLGDNIDARFYNQSLAASTRIHGGLLPATLVKERGNVMAAGTKSDTTYAAVTGVAYSHSALASFEDTKNGNLAGVTFKALWELKPRAEQTSVLMSARVLESSAPDGRPKAEKASEHLPLLLEKKYGKGRVLLFASTCNRARTNFPMSSAFLPWTHQLVCYLAQKPMRRHGFFATGDAVPIPVSDTEGLPPVTVKKPDGTTGFAAMSTGEYPLTFTDTAQAGVYTLFPDQKDRKQMVAVNLDPYESKLTYLNDVLLRQHEGDASMGDDEKIEAGFKQKLADRPLVHYVADPGRVVEIARTARRGFELWNVVLWVVLVLVLFEPWLANRISMRHYSKPRDLPEAAAARTGRWGRVVASETSPAEQEVSR